MPPFLVFAHQTEMHTYTVFNNWVWIALFKRDFGHNAVQISSVQFCNSLKVYDVFLSSIGIL